MASCSLFNQWEWIAYYALTTFCRTTTAIGAGLKTGVDLDNHKPFTELAPAMQKMNQELQAKWFYGKDGFMDYWKGF
jgi:hypothetical protein